MTSKELSQLVVNGMEDRKAEEIVLMDLRDVKGAVTDFFVLCSGNSDTQIESIAESIEKEIHEAISENPWRKEGFTNKEWILIDYVNVVAHIFKKDKRQFYGLEDLWGDAKVIHIDNA
jgi:ribosome-associated protein